MGEEPADGSVPIPPKDAERHSTACRYCIVGCGYEVYKWPVGEQGGPDAEDNALGINYPAGALGEGGVTSNQHTIIEEDGQEYHIIVKPDGDNPVNNQWSSEDHSVRGGTMAQSLYSPYNQTDDRLKKPKIRIGGNLVPVDWDTAIEAWKVATELATERNGPNGYGQKMYFYQFVENTYAGTKLIFDVIGSPNWGGHNRPTILPENPGMRNAGVWQFSYDYSDCRKADTMMITGAEPYENASVIFQEHIVPGVQNGAQIVYIQPRRTFTANYAEENGGIFLQLEEGTDPILLNSIARHIFDQGWQNDEFIQEWTMQNRETIDEEGWYQKEFGVTFDELEEHLSDPLYKPENAAEKTDVPAEKIKKAAELIAKPDSEGNRPRTTFLWEKGLIWGWSHENSAAMNNLPLITGSIGKPGAGVSRLGGHQEGFWIGGPLGDVVSEHSTQTFTDSEGEENTIPPNTVERVKGDEILHWHVIGTNPVRQTYNTQELRNRLKERTGGEQPQTADIDEIKRAWSQRMDNGGMVLTNQEIYPNSTTEFADIVLPATTWGEESNYHRWNGERRLRHYSGFMQGPGDAKPDWQIFSMMGQAMGADDMNWETSEEVFEEITKGADHGTHAMRAIYDKAQQEGKTAAEVVREMDTTGIQLPAKLENGELKGTDRIHQPDTRETPGEGRFHTSTGNAVLMRSDWDRVSDVYEEISPDPDNDEIWVTNGRVNRLWQSLYTHMRDPYIIKRYEQNFIELNPNDAERFGVEAGDLVEIVNDDVYNMHGENNSGSFTAVAYVTDDPPQGQIVPEGTAFTYWLYPEQVANDITPEYLDPANPNPAYKFGKGKIRRLGESDVKEEMSFLPRNVAPEE